MKKNSGVFRISANHESTIRAICMKYCISRSELFRRIITWGISNHATVSMQIGTYLFKAANRDGQTQRSNYLFGSRLSSDMLFDIKKLCKHYGVIESHLYRCFLESYINTHLVGLVPGLIEELRNEKPILIKKTTISSDLFSNPSFKYKLPKPDTRTLIGQLQTSHLEGIKTSKSISELFGLAVVLVSIFSHR